MPLWLRRERRPLSHCANVRTGRGRGCAGGFVSFPLNVKFKMLYGLNPGYLIYCLDLQNKDCS
ncbi:tripeptidyl-peptidase 2 [Platysternon megacephalum]|uniref:Tripeptidyl-peptidase 2 n=1 Tax=Platysternon megacephalum TaxID=55544 RepID=A0A4D9F1R0_9SAUR|nr:tripeptidyl-peptidase 2 [Platysternon megacephalum]